jgi:hypothetical protein
LQRRYGVIRAELIIGGFWALWHVAMWRVGGGWEGQDHLVATANQAVSIVLFRVVMGWIYANGGRSLFLAILIHAVDNTCWKLFPNDGSHYNPTAMGNGDRDHAHHHVRQGATRGGMMVRGRRVLLTVTENRGRHRTRKYYHQRVTREGNMFGRARIVLTIIVKPVVSSGFVKPVVSSS